MSVEANEVFVVKGIMKTMGKFLIVQSLKHGEKHLHVHVTDTSRQHQRRLNAHRENDEVRDNVPSESSDLPRW